MAKINVDLIYPIGSIYININNTNPATFFGGTWEQIQARYLMGAGVPSKNTYDGFGQITNDQISSLNFQPATLGEITHQLSKSELPNIYGTLPHIAFGENKVSGDFSLQAIGGNSYEGANSSGQNNWRYVLNVGNNYAHNNLPPTLVVYIWKRIA